MHTQTDWVLFKCLHHDPQRTFIFLDRLQVHHQHVTDDISMDRQQGGFSAAHQS